MKETKTPYVLRPDFYEIHGIKSWVDENDFYHREDGPAYMYDKCIEWWFHGEPLTFNGWCKKTNKTEDEKLCLQLQYNGYRYDKGVEDE